GPAFELCEHRAVREGSEEYLDSEKYQIRRWDLHAPHRLAEPIGRLNRIRRDNPALQQDHTLRFHDTDNEQLVCFSKTAGDNTVVVVVSLDPRHPQSGWLHLPLDELGHGGAGAQPGPSTPPRSTATPLQMHDL